MYFIMGSMPVMLSWEGEITWKFWGTGLLAGVVALNAKRSKGETN